MGKRKILDTIWEVPDDLWEQIAPLLLGAYIPLYRLSRSTIAAA